MLSRIVQGPAAVATSIVAVFFPLAAVVFNYSPSWDASQEVTRYLLSGGLATLVAWGYLSICIALSTRNREPQVDHEAALADSGLKLSILAGKGIARVLTDLPEGKKAIGHHVVEEGEPSPLSSAYAIRAILACPEFIPSAPLNSIMKYIYRRERDFGWCAASQTQPRPEVSSDVLAIIRALEGESDNYKKALTSVLQQVEEDTASKELTYVATTVLNNLPKGEEQAVTRGEVLSSILNGFVKVDGKTGYWCSILNYRANTPEPSPAATARCVIALTSHSDLFEKESIKEVCRLAMNWLGSLPSYPREANQVVRSLRSGGTEVLVPRHFTSALVVIAAVRCYNFDVSRSVAGRAMKEMLESNSEGFWRWEDGKSAVWMNAQGIEAANSFREGLSRWRPLDA